MTLDAWYIVKQPEGHCEIMAVASAESDAPSASETWGPFSSEGEAIARRVGLIRAGKCQPQ